MNFASIFRLQNCNLRSSCGDAGVSLERGIRLAKTDTHSVLLGNWPEFNCINLIWPGADEQGRETIMKFIKHCLPSAGKDKFFNINIFACLDRVACAA